MLAGSPVSAECMAWFYDNVKSNLRITSYNVCYTKLLRGGTGQHDGLETVEVE